MVQKEFYQYSQRNRYCVIFEDYYRRSWFFDFIDLVIFFESGNIYYRVVFIGEQGVGKFILVNIFAGVYDSMDSDCEVLGGRWFNFNGFCLLQWFRQEERVSGLFVCRVGNCDCVFLVLVGGVEFLEKFWYRFSGLENENAQRQNLGQKGNFLDFSIKGIGGG